MSGSFRLESFNDLDKYLPRQYFKDCLESDVHHMTLILSRPHIFHNNFSVVLKSLNLNISGTRNDIKNR